MKKFIVFILLQTSMLVATAQINTDRVIANGRNALYFEDYILSIQYFNQAIKAKPWLAEPYFYRAIAKLNLDDYNGAEEDCTLALEQNPFLWRAFYARGIARQTLGKYDLAIEDYKKGLEFRLKDRPMMTNLAYAYIQKKDFENARELFNEIIESFPKEAECYMARGAMSLETGDSIAAMDDYNKAIEIDPYYAYAYGSRALLHYQKDSLQKALTDIDEAIRLKPREEGFYINRGLIRYELNNLRGAMSDYDRVISLNRNNRIAHFNRGLLRAQVGDLNNAIDDFNEVIEMEPDNYMAYYNRALLNSQIGSYKNAIKDYDVIINQYPNFLPAYYSRSEAKRKINDLVGADKDYWYAVELEKNKGNKNNSEHDSQTTADNNAQNPDDNSTDKNDTREESDKNISKFNRLVVYDKDEEQKSKYHNEIRGRVQDKNVPIEFEKQFVLTYYENSKTVENSAVYYSRAINQFNERAVLGWKLQITNNEAALNQDQIDAHFASIDEYSAKIEKDPNNADLYFGRGIDYMLVQDFAEAINNFDLAIQHNPKYMLAYFNRAVVRFKQMQYEMSRESQDELAEAMNVKINSTNKQNIFNSTNAPAKFPDNERDSRSYAFEMIMRDYNSVIELDPSFTYAYFNRAYIFCTQHNYKAAIADYNEAIRRSPELAEAYFNRGLTNLAQGNNKRGITDLSKSGELGIVGAYSIIKRITAE